MDNMRGIKNSDNSDEPQHNPNMWRGNLWSNYNVATRLSVGIQRQEMHITEQISWDTRHLTCSDMETFVCS